MSLQAPLQPDQDPSRWDAHVRAYEGVFETLTTSFAGQALDRLGDLAGLSLVDVGAGAGGAAIDAQARGAQVTAVDAAAGMVARIAERAPGIDARVMDGNALDLPDGAFDVGLSCFGVVLFPSPGLGMAELFRVVRPGGRVVVVTWTEPERYALIGCLQRAIAAAHGALLPAGALPAQLRFTDPDRLRALVEEVGFEGTRVVRLEADLVAKSASALAASLAFAPGMAAMLEALGPDRDAVLGEFAARLTEEQGDGEVRLGAVAHAAIAVRPCVGSPEASSGRGDVSHGDRSAQVV